MIPAIVHQSWETADVPAHLVPFQRSIREKNPGLDIRFYDSRARRAYVAQHCPELLPTFDTLKFGVAETDFWSIVAIYVDGGFYADLDMECLRPIDVFRATDTAVFTIESQLMPQRQRELGYEQPFQLATCMFGAPPRHPFFKAFIDRMVENVARRPIVSTDDVEDATGPKALTRLFYALKPRDVGVLEQIYWVPPGLYAGKPLLSRNIHFCHHFDGAWKPKRAKPPLKRQIIERNRLPNPFPRGLWHDFGWRTPAR